MADDDHVQSGRLKRLSRLAYLTARTTGDLLAQSARRKLGGESSSRDEQIEGTPSARLPSGAKNRGVDATVSAGDRAVYGQRLERRLGSLQPVLATRALARIAGRMRSGGELRERHCRHGDLGRQIGRIGPGDELLQV